MINEKQDSLSKLFEGTRANLTADCTSCFGLCCVALPFSASIDFSIDKPAGEPCTNLRSDFRCGVHKELREIGYRGCTVYDCLGAGQKVSQFTYAGQDWRHHPSSAKQMYEVFPIMWQLHELLWYLSEAITRSSAFPILEDLKLSLQETLDLTDLSPQELLELDVSSHQANVNLLLLRTSELVRDEARHKHKGIGKQPKVEGRGLDLIGKNLKGADLRCANLRGAYLIAVNLRGANLQVADFIGADLRDADLRGADLSSSLFLTQAQLNSAKGDHTTRIPDSLVRPEHWNDHGKHK
ncbi:pentapeptide repeat-containing protein [Paenibacillus sp. EC2-1]|uniref:pentapeptide repeat-containing protein n=1 Tax=Paenibacillus sp. EC2-1 TaxID=3388665 RepID=UPI003BEF4797